MNNLSKLVFAYKDGTHNSTSYTYTPENLPLMTVLNNNESLNFRYDGLNRLTKKTLNTDTKVITEYAYINAGTKTTNVLSTEISNAFAYQYTYDNNGNITAIDNGEKLSNGTYRFTSLTGNTYNYDRYNQLTKDTNYITGDITTYTYDTNGNITCKEVANGQNSTITAYTYGDSSWGDLLTKYNGQSITYDAIGNPLNYRDGITMTWQNGRELATFKKGTVDVSYTYDPNGLRTSKSVVEDFVSTEYNYVYENGLLRQMTYGNHVYNISYDVNGTPVSLNHIVPNAGLDEYYYYGVNSRDDVEALYYSDGSLYATYDYDAYGKLLAITSFSGSDLTGTDTVATKNPLRYRSYVYDTETGFYYLQSRYYDPTTCRFINADVYCETGQGINGYNMFAYCGNNPVMYSDPTGHCSTHTYYYMPSCPGCNPEVAVLHATRGADWAMREKEDHTITTGVSFGVNIGTFTWSIQFCASLDFKGNHVLQYTTNYGCVIPFAKEIGIGVTAGSYSTFTNASDVYALEDSGYQVGSGASVPIPNTPISGVVEESHVIIPNGTSRPYKGHSYYKGASFPPGAEIHLQGSYGNTKTIWGFNIFEVLGLK